MTHPDPSHPPPFALTHCPHCGYMLQGLPAGHSCPECGFQPPPGLIVLWGWSAGSLGNMANRRGSNRLGAFCLSFACIAYAAYLVIKGQWCCGSVIAAGITPALYSFVQLRRGYARPPRPTQLQLCAEGSAQRDGFGPTTLRPWAPRQIIEIQRKSQHLVHLRGLTESSVGTAALAFDFEAVIPPDDLTRLLELLDAWISPQGGYLRTVL